MARAEFNSTTHLPNGNSFPARQIRVLDKDGNGAWKISATVTLVDFTKATIVKEANKK